MTDQVSHIESQGARLGTDQHFNTLPPRLIVLKAFHETLTPKPVLATQHFSRQRRLCLHIEKEGRQKGRGRKKLPTCSIKATNNGEVQKGKRAVEECGSLTGLLST